MKSAALPQLRVDPAFYQDAEGVLAPDETRSQFIEQAVRSQIALRKANHDFLQRALASRDQARITGNYHSADEVMKGLQKLLHDERLRRADPGTP